MSSITHPADLPAPAPFPAEDKAIVFDDVAISFEENEVLKSISFALTRGETKVLLGIAGSGKSTILKLALGLLRPDRGRIWVLGQEVTAMTEQDLFALRSRVGMVFQESALFDSLTVRENVGYRLMEDHSLSAGEVEQRVAEALRFVELEHTLDMFPSELSGGMRRRVAIARAIVTRPEVILYDSPTGGLDPITSTTIIELILKQRDVYKTTALMVTHRLQDAFVMATNCFDTKQNKMVPIGRDSTTDVETTFLVLRDGCVIFDGAAEQLVETRDEYIREYIA
ncbi:MAG TPA: ATP-binding cassette domain-containing protein [Terriglobales bacterium]|nr:ATP-binding cassette domain-containing protein [Terriglobales bacterium]